MKELQSNDTRKLVQEIVQAIKEYPRLHDIGGGCQLPVSRINTISSLLNGCDTHQWSDNFHQLIFALRDAYSILIDRFSTDPIEIQQTIDKINKQYWLSPFGLMDLYNDLRIALKNEILRRIESRNAQEKEYAQLNA